MDPFNIPVEGEGDRLQLNVSATIDPLYSSAPLLGKPVLWNAALELVHEMLPVTGVHFWADSLSTTPWAGGSITPGTAYTSNVWVSTDPSSPPSSPFSIAFEADAPPAGGRGDQGGGGGCRCPSVHQSVSYNLELPPGTVPGVPRDKPQECPFGYLMGVH